MQTDSERPKEETSSVAARLRIVPVDEDLEILALWAAALDAEEDESAVDARERELGRSFSEMRFHALAFKRAAPRRHLL